MLTITLFTTHNATALRDIFIFTVTSSKILSTIFKRCLLRDGSCNGFGLLIGGKRKHDKDTGHIRLNLQDACYSSRQVTKQAENSN